VAFRPDGEFVATAGSDDAIPAVERSVPAGIDGAFVAEFVTAGTTTSDQPRYDLDTVALSLVKTYRHQ
jgi:hypothetical protein